jgi:hypothetical protein
VLQDSKGVELLDPALSLVTYGLASNGDVVYLKIDANADVFVAGHEKLTVTISRSHCRNMSSLIL